MVNIQISPQTALTLSASVLDKIKALQISIEDKRLSINKDMDDLSELETLYKKLSSIKEVNSEDLNEIPTDPHFNKDWTWISKIVYVLTLNDEPMTSNEIVADLLKIEPYADRSKVANSVSATLSVHSQDGKKFAKWGQNAKKENLFIIRS